MVRVRVRVRNEKMVDPSVAQAGASHGDRSRECLQ